MNRAIVLFPAAAFVISLASCAVNPIAPQPAATRFLTSTKTDVSHRIERLPFDHAWRDPKVNITKYKNIVVRPVTTAFLHEANWEESQSAVIPNKRAYVRQCQALARYWDKSLAKSFSSPICIYYKTSDTSRPDTLILEVALIDARFPAVGKKPTPSAVPDKTPAPAILTGLPMCAFEARVTDAATGALISTAADRRGPDITVPDPEKKSPASPNETICDEWSRQLMEASNIEIFPTVRRRWFDIF